MTLTILVFILSLKFLGNYIEELSGKNLDGAVMLQLFGHASLRMAILSMPLALLSASLITFGSMGEHYELAALKSCGISLLRILRPLFAFSCLMALLSFWLSFYIVPNSNRELLSLLYDASKTKAGFAIKPGIFYRDIDNYSIRIASKNERTGMLYELRIEDFSQNRAQPVVTLADSGRTHILQDGRYLQMMLYSGVRHEDIQASSPSLPYGRLYFDSLSYRFDLSEFAFSRSDSRLRHRSIFPFPQLSQAIDSMQRRLALEEARVFSRMGRYTGIDSTFFAAQYVAAAEAFSPQSVEEWYTQPALRQRAIDEIRALQPELEYWMQYSRRERQQIREYQHEYYSRIAMPLTCIVFALMGASLGAIIRKGGLGMPAVASVGFFALFYGLLSQGWKLAKYGWADPWIGAFLPLLVFTPFTLYVVMQAAVDAKIFDESSWQMWSDRLRQWLRKKSD